MKVLFVYDEMYTWGGIQTLLGRLSRELSRRGHRVALLTRPPSEARDITGALVQEVERHAGVHYVSPDWLDAPASLESVALPDAHVIVACDLNALLLTAAVQSYELRDARVVAAVYYPREYGWSAGLLQKRWVRHLSRRLMRRLPVQNIVFASESMARQTGEHVGRDMSACPVVPLAIDIERFQANPRRDVDRTKIAAMSRMAGPYTHHRQLIRLIRALRDRGHAFSFHAYGDGPDRTSLEEEAVRLGVEDAVFFHGTVAYDRFEDAVGDAFAFVGHGTSLLEAAALGVPALVAIESMTEPLTYGFLQDTDGADIGAYVPGHAARPIADEVLWLASLDEEGYRGVGAASRARAEQFGLPVVAARFAEALGQAAPHRLEISRLDRAIARVDRVVAAVLWKLGVDTSLGLRYGRVRQTIPLADREGAKSG
jgi:glycosyltransferase involved in cell wall biosynthesis